MQYVVKRSDRPRAPPASEQTPVVAMETDQRSSDDESFASAEEAEPARAREAERHVAAQQAHSAVTQATKPREVSPKPAASAQQVDQRSPQGVQFPLQTPVSCVRLLRCLSHCMTTRVDFIDFRRTVCGWTAVLSIRHRVIVLPCRRQLRERAGVRSRLPTTNHHSPSRSERASGTTRFPRSVTALPFVIDISSCVLYVWYG